MRPTFLWFVCASMTVLSGAVFCAGFLCFDADVLGFIAELMLVGTTALTIYVLGYLDTARTNAVRVVICGIGLLLLLVGVAAKWQLLASMYSPEELRVLTPMWRVAYDAGVMGVVALFWLLQSSFERRVEPYLFVKPVDRPRPRVSPFEKQP